MSYARVPSFGATIGGSISSSGATISGSSGGGGSSGGDSEICRLATSANCLQALVVFAKAVKARQAGQPVDPKLLNSACETTNPMSGQKSINFACLPVIPYMAQLLAQPASGPSPMTLRADLFAQRLAATATPAPAPTGPTLMKAIPYPTGVSSGRQVLPQPSPTTSTVYEGEAPPPPPPAPATGIPTWALVVGGVAVLGAAVFLLK